MFLLKSTLQRPSFIDNLVRRNMKVKTIITDEGTRADKPEYPLKAVREIILNALIHRDYSVHTDRSPIRLVMYEDRLELSFCQSSYFTFSEENIWIYCR